MKGDFMMAVKHVSVRLYLYLLFALFFFTGGLTMFLLFPLYKGAFAPKARFRDLRPFQLWAHVYKVMWRSLTDKEYEAKYPSKLSDPPKLHNDRNLVCIKESWQGEDDNCDMCQDSCCTQLKCPLMVNKRCLSYGSIYFGYLYCGRYPENQAQIDMYQCPKWEMRTANGKD